MGRHSTMTKILQAGLLYFGLVFGCGFLLGPIRILWLVPHFGTRTAELLEAPVMLAMIVLAAGWVVRRLEVPSTSSQRLAMGTIALALMLTAEFGLVLWLRGLTVSEYWQTRDPVSGTVYYLMLGIFALLPLLVRRSPEA